MAVGKSVVILICWSPLKVVFPREFSGNPVVKTLHSLVKTLVWSVVGELRSHKPCSAAKKKLRLKKKKRFYPLEELGTSQALSLEKLLGSSKWCALQWPSPQSWVLGLGNFHQETLLQQVREIVIYVTLLNHPHHCLTIKSSLLSHFLRCCFWTPGGCMLDLIPNFVFFLPLLSLCLFWFHFQGDFLNIIWEVFGWSFILLWYNFQI